MKVITLVLTIGAAAIGISGVIAKAIPQEAVELPASLLNAALANREAGSEAKSPAHHLLPCWRAADDSINCPVVKRDADGARCFKNTEGKLCCPDRDCITGNLVPVKRQEIIGSSDGGPVPVPEPDKFPFIFPVRIGASGCWGINQDDWLVQVTCPEDWEWIPKDPQGLGKPPFEFMTKAPYKSEGCWFINQDNETYRRKCAPGDTPWTGESNPGFGKSKRDEPVPESHKFKYIIPIATNWDGCFGYNQDDWEVKVPCPKDWDWLPKDPEPRFLYEFRAKAPYESEGCWYQNQDKQRYRRKCAPGDTPWTGESKRDEPETSKWELPVATPDKPGCWYVNQDGVQIQHDCPKDGEWPFRRNDCYHISGKVACPKIKRVESKSAHVSSVVLARRPLSFSLSSSSSPTRFSKRSAVNKVAPAWPTLPGTHSPCGVWYPVSDTDHEKGCLGIAAKYGISQGVILDLNKDINAKCTNLKIGITERDILHPTNHIFLKHPHNSLVTAAGHTINKSYHHDSSLARITALHTTDGSYHYNFSTFSTLPHNVDCCIHPTSNYTSLTFSTVPHNVNRCLQPTIPDTQYIETEDEPPSAANWDTQEAGLILRKSRLGATMPMY